MSETAQKTTEYFYDATTPQRFPFTVPEDGQVFETAHHYGVLEDDRYLKFVRAVRVKGSEDEFQAESVEAKNNLWNDLVSQVENFEPENPEDWKSEIDFENEKEPSLLSFLAVAIVEPEKVSTDVRRRRTESDSQTIITEAYFNGLPVKQVHLLKRKSIELSKKYDRIQQKRVRTEKVGGLRGTPNMIFQSQDEKLGQLYDEMFMNQNGFVGGIIPLRFKVVVINYIFAGNAKLDAKK